MPRFVHNVYLDTASLLDYHNHLNGVPGRHKTRVRWYGEMNGDPVRPVLERKLKRGLVSGKLTEPLHASGHEQSLSWAGLQALLAESKLTELLAASLRFLEPSLYNRYHRRYFASMSGNVRLTVDSELSFAPPEKLNGSAPRSCCWNHDPIIELKFEPQHAEEAALTANRLPFRLVRCSKYVLGIECLAGI
jgi:hypothetical protein